MSEGFHLYFLGHVVVVNNQFLFRQTVDKIALRIRNGDRRNYKRHSAFELGRQHTRPEHNNSYDAHHTDPSTTNAESNRQPVASHLARGYHSRIMANTPTLSRRAVLGGTAAFTLIKPHLVRGAGKETLKAGLVGCGGRGTQAVVDMLTGAENVELVAMADIFEDHLEGALKNLRDPKYLARHAGIVVEREGKPKELYRAPRCLHPRDH